MTTADRHTDTVAVHAGREDLHDLGAHVPPIDLSTTYPLADIEAGGHAYEVMGAGLRPDPGMPLVYQRLWNPGVDRFERSVAALEGCDEAVAFATGMAALTATLLACVVERTPHIVAIRPLYGGSDHVLTTGLLGTTVTWATPETVAESIRPDTGLVIFETPGNPTLDLIDISAVVDAAGGVPVLVDNTFATPVLQQPARHGATLVMHSATKFIGGHGDALGGVVAATSEWAARLRRVRAVTGALLHPLAAYEMHRGVQTLPVRVRAAEQGALRVVEWLQGHPAVARVFYPGLDDPTGLVGAQMSGPGSVAAFALRGGYAAAAVVAASCELITHAVSLGSVDTLIQHPAALTHRPVPEDARPHADVLRISVGLEDPADIIADLDKAFAQIV
jgi:cystathionine gamma-synthase/methionine-gamma-lyase